MASPSAGYLPTVDNLHKAICLLALVEQRPPHLHDLLSEYEDISHGKDDDLVADGEELEEDHEMIELNDSVDDQSNLASLRDKVLDRLAETLARFKTDPRDKKKTLVDSKHVSSTMMYYQSTKVKFVCAKNEGLDQDKKKEDTNFLKAWREIMEGVSRGNSTAEQAKASMFSLVVTYQQPRIDYYLKQLQDAFADGHVQEFPNQDDNVKLTEAWLQKVPRMNRRRWIDDSGNEFDIRLGPRLEGEAQSQAAITGSSLENLNEEIGALFNNIHRLCPLGSLSSTADRPDDAQTSLLKAIMETSFDVFGSVQRHAVLQARLRDRFEYTPQSVKRQKAVRMALSFLRRIYLGVPTFVEAAGKMPMFQSIEMVPVTTKRSQNKRFEVLGSPVEALHSLGVRTIGKEWTKYLDAKAIKTAFQRLTQQKRHVHAEIQALHHHDECHTGFNEGYTVQPYIGCSKRCCLLCYCLILVHGGFNVRGTHETVINKWMLPKDTQPTILRSKFDFASEKVFNIVLTILQNLFRGPHSRAHAELVAQSSAALSTARTVLDRELGRMENSQFHWRRLMMMPTIMNDAILVSELAEKPGFAYVIGGTFGKGQEMTVQKAELYKDNHIRLKLGLETRDEMPQKQALCVRVCRRCKRPSNFRCLACRTKYCSKTCQRKDWKRHLFVCAVKNRPNDFDYLKPFLARRACMRQEGVSRSKLLLDLFSDDCLCRTFGFVNCIDHVDVSNLLCIYANLTNVLGSAIRKGMDIETLGAFIEAVCKIWHDSNREKLHDGNCVSWFLQQRAESFDLPNWDGDYMYQVSGLRCAERAFSLKPADEDPTPLTPVEVAVVSLYSHLFRCFNNIPDVQHSEWANFGFCFCTDSDQKQSLSSAYIQLAEKGVPLGDITKAWKTSALAALMKAEGIDISHLEAMGVRFECPGVDSFGIYQLQAEVSHALSGRFCYCFRAKEHCHAKYETILSHESDGDYGFHGTNAWERWQLLNFYHHVFQQPQFDARKMQQAKRDADHKALEVYLDSLVPGFRRKIGDMYLADAMFPKLRNKVSFPNGRPACYCVIHNTIAPEGLDWRSQFAVQRLVREAEVNDGGENGNDESA